MHPTCRVVTLFLAAAALTACGGAQRAGGSPETCRPPAAGMSAEALTDAARCWEAMATPEAAGACRQAQDVASQLEGESAAAFASCVLSARERADGAWLGEFLSALPDDALLPAIDGSAASFDASVHGNSFAAALPASLQDRLGPRLADLTEPARAWIVSTALGYALHPLAGYCGPYVRALDADDPGVAGFARIAARSEAPLDESARWALAASGEWSAADLIACHAGEDARCADWTGESPLALMADVDVEAGNGMAPQRALGLLRSGGTNADESAGLTRFLSNTEYAQRSVMISAVMLDMTDSDTPLETRLAMARGASDAMCAVGVVVDTMLRAHADEATMDDLARPWPTYVNACLEEHWSGGELGPVAASGSKLGVPASLYGEVVSTFQGAVADASCEELSALSEEALQRVGNRAPQSGLLWVVVARAASGRCDGALTPEIVAVSEDAAAHPEARLAAIEWRVDQGDASACALVESAMAWEDEELREGPSAWSEEHAQRLRRRCR